MAQIHISSLMNQYQKDIAAEANFTELYGAIGGSYQPLNSILTSISGLATNVTGLIKLTNGVASLDTNTYALASSVPTQYIKGASVTGSTLTLTKQDGTTVTFTDTQVTSINGLSGGSLTSPLVIKGGDGAGVAKIALDHTQSGQITDESTHTLFGFTTNGTTTLTIGHSSYAMALRGSGTRPTYNGNNLALYSDIPSVPTVNNGTLTIQKNGTSVGTFTANQSGNTTANVVVNNGTLTIQQNGVQVTTFGADQSGNATANIDTHNPNLLINPDFAINQRGSATYTGANKYTCDRWIVYQASSACVVTPRTSGGVKVDNSTGSAFATFRQYIEDYSKLGSKTLTISLYVNSKNGDVKIFAAGLTSSTTYSNVLTVGLNTLTINTIASPTATQIGLNLPAYSWIDISYMKVEIGNVATTFSPPTYAEEIVKCCRYYQKIKTTYSSNVFGFGSLRNSTNSRYQIPLTTPLRATPVMGYSSGIYILNLRTGGITSSGITTTIFALNDRFINLQSTTTTSMGNSGDFMQLYGNTGNDYIQMDAEIY